jgi:putative lipoprotein
MSRNLLLAMTVLIGTVGCAGQPPAAAGPTLIGSDWVLISLNGAEPLADSEITLSFGTDGRVTGSSGCNRYFGAYRLADESGLEIGPLAGTRMFCQGALGKQETRYLEALEATTGYALDQRLRLFQPSGALEFRPAR